MKEATKTEGLLISLKESEANQKPGIVAFIYEAFIAALLFIGIAGGLYGLFEPLAYLEALIPVGLMATVALYACWAYKRLRLPGFIVLAVCLAAWILLLQGDMINGFNLVATKVGDVLGQNFGRMFPIFEVSVLEEGYALSATLFLIPVCLLIALLCSFLASTSSTVLTVLVMVLFFAGSFVLNQTLVFWPFLALIVAVLLVACSSFGVRSNYQGRFSRGSLQVGATVLVLSAATLALVGLIAAPADYKQLQSLTDARDSFERSVDRARYGVDTSRGMPDGDFINLGSLNLSEETALEVTMEEPQSLWLRGYVGSVYSSAGWEQDRPEDLYTQKDLFFWLHEDGFYGQTQLSDAAVASGVIGAFESTRMSIRNIGASSRNIYAPYEAYLVNEELIRPDVIGDTGLYSEGWTGLRDYSFSAMPNQVKQFPVILNVFGDLEQRPNVVASNYLAVEGYYAKFAEESYSEVDSEVQAILDDLLPENESAMTFNDAKQVVLDVLTSEVSYQEQIAPLAPTDDFVTNFLTTTQEGYSVHYATAGTLMFRHLGFPARYVEGYLITPADVKDAAEYSALTLDGTHAHAWTEVYLDGVGWIPVELTPPYLDIMEQADTLQGVNTSNGPSDEASEEPNTQNTDPVLADTSVNASVEMTRAEFPWWVVIVGAILLVLAILVSILTLVFLRRRALNERVLLFGSDNHARAITAMFHYCMDLLSALGLESKEILRLQILLPHVAHLTAADNDGFVRTFSLYEEAAYSQHAISAAMKEEVASFTNSLAVALKERSRGFDGIRVKLILRLI